MNYAFDIPWLTIGLIVAIITTRAFVRETEDSYVEADFLYYGIIAFAFFLFWILSPVILCLAVFCMFGRFLVRMFEK